MALSRSGLRNINIYDAMHPDVALGGLCQNGSITEENFLSFLEILLVIPGGTLRVQARACGHIVTRVNTPLATGAYDIYCNGMYSTHSYFFLPRMPPPADILLEFSPNIRLTVSTRGVIKSRKHLTATPI